MEYQLDVHNWRYFLNVFSIKKYIILISNTLLKWARNYAIDEYMVVNILWRHA